MATRIIITLSLLLFWVAASAQVKLTTTDIMYIRQKLQIATDTSKYFTSITDTITAASTHREAPTAKAVWELLDSLGGGGGAGLDTSGYNLNFRISGDSLYIRDGDGELFVDLAPYIDPGHVIAGNGTPVSAKDTLDFLNNDIQFNVANVGDATTVIATISADSVNSTHIQAGAVGNSELASNAVDSSKIVAGGVSVTDIGQHGAASGQAMKWNGTQWAPADDDDLPAIATDQIAYGTGTGITSSYTAKVNQTSPSIGGAAKIYTTGGGITADSVDATASNGLAATSFSSGAAGFYGLYLHRNGGTGPIVGAIVNETATSTSHSSLEIYTSSSGGDANIRFGAGTTAIIGMDNSDDLWKIDYGSNLDGTYALGVNSSNLVGIGGAPVTGKALTVTGELRVTDLTTDNPSAMLGVDADGDISRTKLGTGLSLSNDTLRCTVSGGDDWGTQVVEVDGTTIVGDGTSGDPLSWNGAYVSGALSGNGYSGTPITILNDGITQQYIGDSAVTSQQIRDTTIVAADIKDATITNAKLADGVGGIYKGSGEINNLTFAKTKDDALFAFTYFNDNPAIAVDDANMQVAFGSEDGTNQLYLSNVALFSNMADSADFKIQEGVLTLASTGGTVKVGGGAAATELRLLERSGAGFNYSGFLCGDMSTNQMYTLPTDAPSDGDVLTYNTGDILSWESVTGGATDHGALTGLGDDDHSQYALLAGRSGGQSLTGGTASAENLTLNSTSHATKGAVLIGTDNSKTVVGASVYFRADIAPSGLSADTDDWNPSGLDTASTLRIYATDTVNLTGLQGGSDGRILYVYNIGEFPITLKTNTTSTSAYRFFFDADIELKYNQGIILQYDGTASKWRAAGSTTWARSAVSYEYTTAQTNTALTVPTGAKSVYVLCVGGGGGGGGGRRGAAGSIRSGGGGGASGGVSFATFPLSTLGNPPTLYVNLSGGGTSGAAATSDDTNGGNGGSASDSDVRASTSSGDRFINAAGGSGGTGGDADGAAGGLVSSTSSMLTNYAGAASSATGAAGSNSGLAITNSGGGSGGGITTGNSSSNGGSAGFSCMSMYSPVTGGAGGSSGSNGSSSTQNPAREYGQGGSGGGSGSAGTGGNGGTGIRGGGGGGGGASVNGNNSGAGGAGGPGYVKIIFYF